ncbi:DUF6503 family protein [Geojedonia litorea]|uniref:DUF6503 family protein n=1 Tax=Geojedonia litorea TaxID=1268269 RepID=A0ABV9N694_9FLAO
MKIKFTFCMLLIFVISSCKEQEKSGSQVENDRVGSESSLSLTNSEADLIVNKAIAFAGGLDAWKSKKSLSYTKLIQNYDSLGNLTREISQLHQYQLQPSFKAKMSWEDNGDAFVIINNGKRAWQLKNGEVLTSEEATNSAWNSSFGSHYVIGMPFKLKDPGTILTYEGVDTLSNGEVVHAIKATYEKGTGSSGGMHTWWYFFDKNTYELKANFLDSGNGYSITQYFGYDTIDTIKINKQRKSYRSNENRDLVVLGTVYSNTNIEFNVHFEDGYFN